MKIYGGGLAGLLAGTQFQNAIIFEAGPADQAQHKAVLRFRTPAVSEATGIDFRKVRVHKGIFSEGRPASPSIRLANQYSMKVVGCLQDRSIWHLDPVDRYIAPETFLEQLAERCGDRIQWNHSITENLLQMDLAYQEPIISTLPMIVMAKLIGKPIPKQDDLNFTSSPITVKRWRIPKSDVFQSIYFPDPDTPLFRASITGDLLIAEYVSPPSLLAFVDTEIAEAFGIDQIDPEQIDTTTQRFGKIIAINDAWRKQYIYELSRDHNIFSLGRFGTWRNILLDDVLHDIAVIKRLTNVGTYDRARIAAR
jgi:hypothetical protein